MSISCLCITYLRTSLLEEAIECFLRQTYKGPKELIIINDAENQHLEFDHPDVFILNSKRRFRTIGEKRNVSVSLAKYDYLAVWDDDDIFLPHRLEYCFDKIKQYDLDYYKLDEAFYYDDNKIKKICTNMFFSSSIFSRKLYVSTEGHGFVNSGQDVYLESQFWERCQNNEYKSLTENLSARSPAVRAKKIKKEDIYYIYRWGNVSYHLSSTLNKKDPLQIIKTEREKTDTLTGRIKLNPHLKKDYFKMCKDFLSEIN